jgi:hypothetical protein
VIVVVPDVETRGDTGSIPYVVVDLSVGSLAPFHADAPDRDVVIDLVIGSAIV